MQNWHNKVIMTNYIGSGCTSTITLLDWIIMFEASPSYHTDANFYEGKKTLFHIKCLYCTLTFISSQEMSGEREQNDYVSNKSMWIISQTPQKL